MPTFLGELLDGTCEEFALHITAGCRVEGFGLLPCGSATDKGEGRRDVVCEELGVFRSVSGRDGGERDFEGGKRRPGGCVGHCQQGPRYGSRRM